MSAPTLTEFLLARIAEMGRAATAWHIDDDGRPKFFRVVQPDGSWLEVVSPALIHAECEAKRRIVERHSVIEVVRHEDHAGADDIHFCAHCGTDLDEGHCPDLIDLASVYVDHPDYDDAWRASASSDDDESCLCGTGFTCLARQP